MSQCLSVGSLEMMTKILRGQTYSQCSVMAAAQPTASVRRMFDLVVRLEGWREEVVMEVITKHFSHSPNKVLALQLKLSHSQHQPHRNLLNCPLLAQLACLAYEDTGELPSTASESLHTMMRSVLRRELYTAGRTLHNTNYEVSLVRLGERCLHSLARGRLYLRAEETAGLVRKYRQTLLGFLTLRQSSAVTYRRDKQRRELYEPLHRSLMEFTAAFYLKSLSQSNQQDQIGREVTQLFENNCQSTENILASALEMLAPDNACSDILTRIPQQIVGPEVGVARLVRLGEEEVGVSVPGEVRCVLDLPARLRLLQTAGFTAHSMTSLLSGLRELDQPPVIICHQHLLQAWTNIVEVRPDLVRSLEVSWRSDCGPLCHLGLERFFTCLAASRLTQISLSLNFCPLLSQTEPADQLRYAGHLLGLLTTSLNRLTLKVEVEGEREGEGEDINVFPLLDALAGQVKVSTSLTRLEVEVEVSSSQLSLVCSSLQSSQSVRHLSIRGARPALCSAGFKQLKQLVRSGKIEILEFSSSTSSSELEDQTDQEVEAENQYVYEDEALLSEECKLRKLSPLLTKITGLAGLRPQEISPVEISAGRLHPCLRWSSVHPLPLCCNSTTATHYICQGLASKHTTTHHLDLTITHTTDILCLADALVSNCSLRSLKVSSRTKEAAGAEMSLCFPLLLGVSSHLGLTNLDLSGLSFSLNSECLQLCLAALASNTALSLSKLNISGWSFCCQITEKTNMMQSLSELWRTSRISHFDLSHCTIDLSCNHRQFSLYFELEAEDRARSLWQDIHDDKISSPTLTELDLAGVKMRINKKEMFLPQELSMLDCPKLEVLNLSQSPLDVTQPPAKCLHLFDVLENLPASLLWSVQRLHLDHHCLHQNIPASQTQEMRNLLASLAELKELSLSGSWLGTGGGGRREELLKYCLEFCPQLETLQLNNCYLSKDVGASMSRSLKTRAKKGLRMKIGVRGCCGGGLEKMMTLINLSKFVFCQLDSQTGVLTIQRV